MNFVIMTAYYPLLTLGLSQILVCCGAMENKNGKVQAFTEIN